MGRPIRVSALRSASDASPSRSIRGTTGRLPPAHDPKGGLPRSERSELVRRRCAERHSDSSGTSKLTPTEEAISNGTDTSVHRDGAAGSASGRARGVYDAGRVDGGSGVRGPRLRLPARRQRRPHPTTQRRRDDTRDFDWDNFFGTAGEELALPAGFDASGFDRDFITNANGSFNTVDKTTFATGSKDTLPITPGWQCNTDNNVLSKTDVMNAYAAVYIDPGRRRDHVLRPGAEREHRYRQRRLLVPPGRDRGLRVSTAASTAFTGITRTATSSSCRSSLRAGRVARSRPTAGRAAPTARSNPDSVAEGAACCDIAGDDDICAQVNTGTLTTSRG